MELCNRIKLLQTPTNGTSQVLHEGWRPVSLSKLDKAPQIELDKTLSTATSRMGYRMVGIGQQRDMILCFISLCHAGGPTAALVQARATHGACEGTWYYELTIVHLGASGHVRLGWSTRKGELQAPVRFHLTLAPCRAVPWKRLLMNQAPCCV